MSFNDVIRILCEYYESIFNYDYVYDVKSLKIIYTKRNDHKRYQNLIDKFYRDLKSSLREKREYAGQFLIPRKRTRQNKQQKPIVNIEIIYDSNFDLNDIKHKVTYHYELGKLSTKRDRIDFNFFADALKSKCLDNDLVLKELEHMESNLSNDIEYYCAHRLICSELKEDNE